MRKLPFALAIWFLTVSASFAAAPSDASLKGPYSFQMIGVDDEQWGASINCPNGNGGTYTLYFGGSTVKEESIVGVATFDGKGNVTGSFTDYGRFDQADSNATVVPSCAPGGGSNGNAVYYAPSPGTFTGTYSIQSTGLGSMTITVSGVGASGPNTFTLELGGTAAVRTTFYMVAVDPNNRVDITGSGTLQ